MSLQWQRVAVAVLLSGGRSGLSIGGQGEEGKGPPVAVLVDTDPALTAWLGLDVNDDLAVAFLAGTPHVRILGATSTFGNAPAWTTCLRLQALLKELNLQDTVPVACGPSWRPWARTFEFRAWLNHGFSNISHPNDEQNKAAEQMARLTRDFRRHNSTAETGAPQRLVWLSLGAMTNVAAALKLLQQPDTLGPGAGDRGLVGTGTGGVELPDEVVVLGARLPGGWELNVWSDASAAEYVLVEATSFVRVTLVPVDVVAGAVVGVRQLNQFKSECKGSWITEHISVLKRYAWLAGHLQPYMVVEQVADAGEPRGRGSVARPAHGFRPRDVAAAAAVAYPGQMFAKNICQRTERSGSGIHLYNGEVPCGLQTGTVRVLSQLAIPQFLAVMFNGLCTVSSVHREIEGRTDLNRFNHHSDEDL